MIDHLSAGIGESKLQDVKEALSVILDLPDADANLKSQQRYDYILTLLALHGFALKNAISCARIIANNMQKMLVINLQSMHFFSCSFSIFIFSRALNTLTEFFFLSLQIWESENTSLYLFLKKWT